MGLDCGITASKKKEYLTSDADDRFEYDEIRDNPNFLDEDGNFIWPNVCEVWYARKFWGLIKNMRFLENAENGSYTRVKKEDLKEMIEYYCFHEDYFENFRGLPKLCELYRDYDDLTAQGVKLWFWISY